MTPLGIGREPSVLWEHAPDELLDEITLLLEISTMQQQEHDPSKPDNTGVSGSSVTARYRVGPGGTLQLALAGTLVFSAAGTAEPVVVAIPSMDPDTRSAALVARALKAAGVRVGRVSVVDKTPRRFRSASAKCIHVIHSAPVRDIIRNCMQVRMTS